MKTTLHDIHRYKVRDLTPDELDHRRKNQSGVWIDTGITGERAAALREARRRWPGQRLRAVPLTCD